VTSIFEKIWKTTKVVSGVINIQTGPVSYTIQFGDDREVYGYQDQVIQRETSEANEVIDPYLKGQPFQTNKWLAKKMQHQQPNILRDRHLPDYYSQGLF
jgi:hypothetical protein